MLYSHFPVPGRGPPLPLAVGKQNWPGKIRVRETGCPGTATDEGSNALLGSDM